MKSSIEYIDFWYIYIGFTIVSKEIDYVSSINTNTHAHFLAPDRFNVSHSLIPHFLSFFLFECRKFRQHKEKAKRKKT